MQFIQETSVILYEEECLTMGFFFLIDFTERPRVMVKRGWSYKPYWYERAMNSYWYKIPLINILTVRLPSAAFQNSVACMTPPIYRDLSNNQSLYVGELSRTSPWDIDSTKVLWFTCHAGVRQTKRSSAEKRSVQNAQDEWLKKYLGHLAKQRQVTQNSILRQGVNIWLARNFRHHLP